MPQQTHASHGFDQSMIGKNLTQKYTQHLLFILKKQPMGERA
jgi:hypothetical protein